MIEYDFLIIGVGQKHLLLKHLTYSLVLIAVDDLHPLLQTLPLPEHDEEAISADLIKGLHLFKPLLDGYELRGFGVDELADSLAAERVVVLYLLADDLRVGHYFHVVVVVLVPPDHVDELISRQLLLTHHVEESSHFFVRPLGRSRSGTARQEWRNRLHFHVAGYLH